MENLAKNTDVWEYMDMQETIEMLSSRPIIQLRKLPL